MLHGLAEVVVPSVSGSIFQTKLGGEQKATAILIHQGNTTTVMSILLIATSGAGQVKAQREARGSTESRVPPASGSDLSCSPEDIARNETSDIGLDLGCIAPLWTLEPSPSLAFEVAPEMRAPGVEMV